MLTLERCLLLIPTCLLLTLAPIVTRRISGQLWDGAEIHSSPLRRPDEVESRWALGERIRLSEIPLDLLEEIPGIPTSAALLLFERRETLCTLENDEAKTLQQIKGIGEKRSEVLLQHFTLPKCKHSNGEKLDSVNYLTRDG